MKKKHIFVYCIAVAAVFCMAACGGGKKTAASMHLVRTEGAVQVDDEKGKSVEIMENLGLYSGYGVITRAASYGWIHLDDVKLAKMDQESEVEIEKEGKLLEINVRSGGLFFNVTEPLAEDETMNIRTSTMFVGIRGTCGWVETETEDVMNAYLLKGQVECTIVDEKGNILASAMLDAGQTARMEYDGKDASITVEKFSDIPDFVAEEIDDDDIDPSLLETTPPETETEPESETETEEESDDGDVIYFGL